MFVQGVGGGKGLGGSMQKVGKYHEFQSLTLPSDFANLVGKCRVSDSVHSKGQTFNERLPSCSFTHCY